MFGFVSYDYQGTRVTKKCNVFFLASLENITSLRSFPSTIDSKFDEFIAEDISLPVNFQLTDWTYELRDELFSLLTFLTEIRVKHRSWLHDELPMPTALFFTSFFFFTFFAFQPNGTKVLHTRKSNNHRHVFCQMKILRIEVT